MRIFLAALACCFACELAGAAALANNTNRVIVDFNGYSAYRDKNGNYEFSDPSEFWRGVWKEGSNGWRVQLRVLTYTNIIDTNTHAPAPLLSVEWGGINRNSFGGYVTTPNNKFAKFELTDRNGNLVPLSAGAGSNLLGLLYGGYKYPTNVPTWASPAGGSLEEVFPAVISTNVYPHFPGGEIAGHVVSMTNNPPEHICFINLESLFVITNDDDYTLTVQPVLYKRFNHTDNSILDRVDLPCVTMRVHLLPNQTTNTLPQP